MARPGGQDRFGPTAMLSDGDVGFQPRKLQRSGLWHAVQGRALVCVHKEEVLDVVQRHHPAMHCVMVDDKLRILAAVEAIWRERLTTVFVRLGHCALDPNTVAAQAAAHFSIEDIGELADLDLSSMLKQPAEQACANQECR